MRKTFRDPDLLFVVCAEDFSDPLAKRGRAFPNIDGHIEYDSGRDPDQLPLRTPDLIVQPSQHMFRRTGVIVLDKSDVCADGLLKFSLIKALEEEPPLVPVDSGIEHHHIGYGKRDGIHMKKTTLHSRLWDVSVTLLHRHGQGNGSKNRLVQHPQQVLPISVFHQRLRQLFQVSRIDPFVPIGDFFRARDFQSLSVFHGGNELTRSKNRLMGPGVQPGISSSHDLDIERAFLQVEPVQVRDFQFAPCGRREGLCALHDV